jgi:hypothetical protein
MCFRGSMLRIPTLQSCGEYQASTVFLWGALYTGMWRSLVARTAGGREVASSSLVTPTIYMNLL